jgi:hypothetical protein
LDPTTEDDGAVDYKKVRELAAIELMFHLYCEKDVLILENEFQTRGVSLPRIVPSTYNLLKV